MPRQRQASHKSRRARAPTDQETGADHAVVPERASRARQRQRLIEACISALHIHGPSRTTVEKVVALADLSPGIVRFYFDSKDAMLVASLAYLAAEFEERVMAPVSSLKDTPVKALEQLVELYLDPQIASPRKVSVWYSFWGEASSRQEYLEICGNKDEAFAALVRELIEAMIIRTAQSHLDADAVALGLIGVLEVLWQGFAFTEEARIDRDAAKRRSLAYLGSVFPGHFQRPGGLESRQVGSQAGNLPAWAYSDATLLGLERDRLFRPSWQLVGHEADLPNPGDYLTADLAGERVLLVKIGERDFRAFRNACRRRPHALLTGVRGHLSDGIACKVHGLVYELDGRLHSGDTPGNLTTLQLALHGGFILVHAVGVASAGVSVSAVPGLTGAEWQSIPDLQPDGVADTLVAADWKLIMEQWIEAPPRPPGTQRTFLPPNQVLERSERGVMFLQVIPQAPGRSVIRRRDYSVAAVRSNSRSRGPQVSRGEPGWLRQDIEVAESTQAGLAAGIEEADDTGPLSPQLVDFRRTITALLPLARSGGD